MIRTQIYLSQKQYQTLLKKAYEKKSTLSAVIRDLIDKELKPKENKKNLNSGDTLLAMIEEAKKLNAKGPKDLASNVDKYLYGRED